MPTEIEMIRQTMEEARKAYYEGEAIMTDDEYDALEEKLRSLDKTDSLLSAVGTAPSGSIWQKRVHETPMGSLNKVKGVSGLHEWWAKTAIKAK